MARFALVLLSLLFPAATLAATLQVGPGKPYAKPCEAVAAAAAGDTIEVDAAGGPYQDTCAIQKALTLRGVNGRPVMDLGYTDHPAWYKGAFVIAASNVTIDNFEIKNVAISAANGENGAAVRIDTASPPHDNVTITRCYFHHNQNGILGVAKKLTIEYSEFDRNGAGNGCSGAGCTHNIYITGASGEVTFRYNYSHTIATDGHLFKSRADKNYVLYNRFTGEDGHDSYGIDLPNGGLAVVVGNLVQKGTNPGNYILLAYGEEGSTKSDNRLFVAHNTFVNDSTKGTFLNVKTGTLTAHNNLFVGPGTVSSTGALPADNLATQSPGFVDRAGFDYRLAAGSPAIDQGVDPGSADTFSLTPDHQYLHPAGEEPRAISGSAPDLGAYELAGGPVVRPDAGTSAGPDAAASAGPDAAAVCVPTTCEAQGKNCGTVPDGCGGTLPCGDCPTGETCGAGGANQCGTGTCTPTTCQAQGKNCGTIPDGCSATLDCGQCALGVCGAAVANVCGCVAETDRAFCTRLGARCGVVTDFDNCDASRTVNCGTCVGDAGLDEPGATSGCGCSSAASSGGGLAALLLLLGTTLRWGRRAAGRS